MIQLRVDDWPSAVAWYRDVLGLPPLMLDVPGRFALLDAGGARLAIKARETGRSARPSDSALVFEVADFDAERNRLLGLGEAVGLIRENHAEGFREFPLTDPEGNAVTVFAWF
jgi:catechol 2,3-dioxygenase-like lactoylglutathione lyase family enzyme